MRTSRCLLLACLLTAPPAWGANVLLVTAGSTPTSQESLRTTQFESWGHTVTTLAATSSQAQYDTALSGVDVAWVTEEVLSSDVGYKLRETSVGVICGEPYLDNELGISTSDGFEQSSTNQILVTSNSHSVSSDLSIGFITIFTSTQTRSLANPTTASGLTVLATGSSGDPALAVLEAGATLANTYNSNSTASGRRVRLPWGGSSFDWSSLDADGLSIARNAILWAAGESLLTAQWRLDETTGATAADSGGGGFDGVYTNGVSLAQDGPYPGAEAPEFDGSDDHIDLPNLQADFSAGLTIAAWVNPSSAPSGSQLRTFFNMSNGANVDEVWFGWVGNSGLQLYLSDTADGGSVRTIEDNSGFTLGRWVHCVATVDASGNATLYRNGQVTKSGFSTGLPTSVQRTETQIATSPWGDHFTGGIQDVRVINWTLTQGEVAELYGLVGHWDFDEGTGSTAADSTGAASDATFLTGSPQWVTGARGTALEFDGASDVRTAETITPPDVGAVALWIRSDGAPASRHRPWGLGADFEMWQDTDGLVSMDLSTDGFQGGFITTDPLDTAGRWHHVVAQYDSSDDSYEIYLDGQLHKSGVSTREITQQAANFLTFGTRTGNTQRFTGALDDFRLYNRWLAPTEIAELYGLVGWWKLDETSGTTAVDSSGAGSDGDYVGSPTLGSTSSSLAPDGTAVEFDGVSQHVDTGQSLMNDLEAFTLTGWIKPVSTSPDRSFFGQNDLIELGIDVSANQIDLWTANGGSLAATHTLPVNSWSHLVAVGDGAELRLYVNGVLITSEVSATSGYGANSDIFRIGEGVLDPTGDPFNGVMDDVRLYNRVLTPEEIQELAGGDGTPGVRIVRWLEVANP